MHKTPSVPRDLIPTAQNTRKLFHGTLELTTQLPGSSTGQKLLSSYHSFNLREGDFVKP